VAELLTYLLTYLLNSFISHDNAPNSISAGAPTQTPMGRSTCLPPRFDNPGYGPVEQTPGKPYPVSGIWLAPTY